MSSFLIPPPELFLFSSFSPLFNNFPSIPRLTQRDLSKQTPQRFSSDCPPPWVGGPSLSCPKTFSNAGWWVHILTGHDDIPSLSEVLPLSFFVSFLFQRFPPPQYIHKTFRSGHTHVAPLASCPQRRLLPNPYKFQPRSPCALKTAPISAPLVLFPSHPNDWTHDVFPLPLL